MSKFNIEVELDWMNEEGGFNLDEMLRDEIVSNIQNRITKNIQEKLEQEMYEKLSVRVNEFVDNYIANILPKSVDSLQIPVKEGTWNSKVEYVPLSEFIGKRYDAYLNEKRLDVDGRMATRDSERRLSITEYLLNNYFGKEVNSKVEAMIKTARADAEKTIVQTLENNIKEQLSIDIIKKLNIPQMLVALEEKSKQLI